jgi:hypothetical protein
VHVRPRRRPDQWRALLALLGLADMSEITISMSPVAVSRAHAATALGMSLSFFETEIQPELRLVRRKSKVLVPVAELERWLAENAERMV